MTQEEKEGTYWDSTGSVDLRSIHTKEMQIRMVNQKADLLKDNETVIASQVGEPESADCCTLFPVG